MNLAHVIITCEAYVTVSGGRRVPFESPEARTEYPDLAKALDDLPVSGSQTPVPIQTGEIPRLVRNTLVVHRHWHVT